MSHKNNLVPASLQRVRCFLANQGRFKVKPWAGVDETLDALHDALLANQGNDGFWTELGDLLAVLSQDINRRTAALGNDLIDNEVLSHSRHRQLLDEIRSALATRQKGRGGFRGLTAALSAPAARILVIIGTVTTVGCYQSVRPGAPDGAVQEQVDGGAQPVPWTQDGPGPGQDGPGYDAATPEKNGSVPPSVDSATPPNPPPPPEPPPPRPDAGSTLQEIVDSCFSDINERRQILTCVRQLHSSWETGLIELFQNSSGCAEIASHIDCLLGKYDRPPLCDDPERTGQYDLDTLFNNCAVYIYEGVRFE